HLGWFRGLGIALSVAGAMIVIGRGDIFGLLAGQVGTGELLLLGCVVSWVAYTLIGRRVLRGLSPLVAVSYASVVGTVLLGLVTLSQGGIGLAAMQDLQVWLNIAYLAVFGTVLAFVWFYKGVQALGASRAAQFINLVPVSGVCLGAWLLDEPVTWSLLSGGLLVLLGLWLTNRPSGGSAAQVPERV
ncbi:MAG: DMT family transporter, partial [Sedimenticolaceae bacterium]